MKNKNKNKTKKQNKKQNKNKNKKQKKLPTSEGEKQTRKNNKIHTDILELC